MNFFLQALVQEPKMVKFGYCSLGKIWKISGESDEENQENWIFVVKFAITGNLNHLGRADIWYGDGTFSVCPNIYYQLYTTHAEVHGQIVPLVYSLLPSKSKQCYKLVVTVERLNGTKRDQSKFKGLQR